MSGRTVAKTAKGRTPEWESRPATWLLSSPSGNQKVDSTTSSHEALAPGESGREGLYS